ncbi:MAG: hypothetical protein IID32_10710 [Planctomycetes bacterium]|nr:hypothetical protein [Planctomycetota bacterium]
MKVISEWIRKLDLRQPLVETDHETIAIQYADVEELANQLTQALQQMPGQELRANVLIQPLSQAKQIMIFGSAKNREMIKQFILEIDVAPGTFMTKHFKLKHADPERIKEDIETLFSETLASNTTSRYTFNYNYGGSRRRQGLSSNLVRAIAFPALKQVTVIASEENMVKVGQQIAEWDKPIDVDAVKPMIVTLRNSDAVKMANLLSTLFTEDDGGGSNFPFFFFGGGSTEDRRKIVGPLYGQLAFEAVPDTKKIVVISKIPEAYAVVRKLIEELDEQDIADLPMMVTLKYADAEDLCEQLNALLNEPGTPATIRRSQRGLSDYDQNQQTGQGRAANTGNNQNQNQQQNQSNVITPWWTQQRSTLDEMPTSNLIGKVRFVPVARSKAILVLAPPEYRESLRLMIEELDKPGKQVMIKAVIIEVNRENLKDVGIKLSSNPAAFGVLGESVVATVMELALGRVIDRDSGKLTGEAAIGMNVSAVVDFLVKEAGARVLNEPTLWTKDNEEASFFRGGSIPFLAQSQTSVEGGSITTTVEYRPVGVTLRVRPNITPEKAVNMTVHLIISQVRPELINGNIATSEVNASTHMTIKDGETLLMGGILFQDESETVSKLPFLGDIPILGELFKHRSTIVTNNEMMVFITPYVMDEDSSEEAEAELENAIDRMESVREQLSEVSGG